MATQTFLEIVEELQSYINDESSDTEARLRRIINDGQREIGQNIQDWWYEHRLARIQTKAPYSTGTATATKGSANVTISGGSFTGLTGYKFSFGTNKPYYRITAVAGNGLSATIESPFTEDTLSAAPLVYCDEYELPSTLGKIISVKLLRAGWPAMVMTPFEVIESFHSVPEWQSIPNVYSIAPNTSNNNLINIQVTPIPNRAYTIEIRYFQIITDMVNDSDTPTLPPQFIPALKTLSLYRAYTLDFQNTPEGTQVYQEFERQITDLRRTTSTNSVPTARPRPFDSAPNRNQLDRGWLWRSYSP